jgi:hypothetical protein
MSSINQSKPISTASQVKHADAAGAERPVGGIVGGMVAQLRAQNDPKLAPLVKTLDDLLAAGQKANKAP